MYWRISSKDILSNDLEFLQDNEKTATYFVLIM